MNTDPVQTIKEHEAKAQEQIDALSQENNKKLEEKTIELGKNLEEYKETLRKEGQASLQTAKQEAMNAFKKITDSEDRDRSSLISQASSKKPETIKHVVSSFDKYLAN
jgi:vacuolar-type H+-ATPase subunit H